MSDANFMLFLPCANRNSVAFVGSSIIYITIDNSMAFILHKARNTTSIIAII